ncbi:MAG: ATP-binding protein, partial [Bacteroidota bacterium]
VLLNLCVNARDAMPKGGTLSFKTSTVLLEQLNKKYADAHDNEYVCMQVSDTGTGIEREILERIFEPFFTTKERGKGTGLGLSVVYGTVKSHRGFIDVQSEDGKGTTFFLYFPVQPLGVEKIKKHTERLTSKTLKGSETILLVEDEESLMEVLVSLLEEAGYNVISAEDGEEAVAMFSEFHKDIAIVVSDLGLPRLSGWEAYLKMKEIQPRIKAILASGYLDPAIRAQMNKEGVRDFMQKPYDPQAILQKIREVIDRQTVH